MSLKDECAQCTGAYSGENPLVCKSFYVCVCQLMEAGGNWVMVIYVCVRECTVYYMYFINEPACCTIGTTKKICALYTFSGYEYNYELGRFSSFLKAFFTELCHFLCTV